MDFQFNSIQFTSWFPEWASRQFFFFGNSLLQRCIGKPSYNQGSLKQTDHPKISREDLSNHIYLINYGALNWLSSRKKPWVALHYVMIQKYIQNYLTTTKSMEPNVADLLTSMQCRSQYLCLDVSKGVMYFHIQTRSVLNTPMRVFQWRC